MTDKILDQKWLPIIIFLVGIIFGMMLPSRNNQAVVDLKTKVSILEDSIDGMRMETMDLELTNLRLILLLRNYRNMQ